MDQPSKDPALDPVSVGALIEVSEPDYCYGSGRLRLRVTAVGPPFRWLDRDWWQDVRGVEIHWDGRELAERPAHVRVRGVRPLPRQRRG